MKGLDEREKETDMMNYETLAHFEEVDKTLAYIYRELCDSADAVNRELRDLEKMTQDNAERFTNGAHLFYNRSTAEQAADFERAFAKYETLEQLFWTSAHEAGIDRTDVATLIIDARKGR